MILRSVHRRQARVLWVQKALRGCGSAHACACTCVRPCVCACGQPMISRSVHRWQACVLCIRKAVLSLGQESTLLDQIFTHAYAYLWVRNRAVPSTRHVIPAPAAAQTASISIPTLCASLSSLYLLSHRDMASSPPPTTASSSLPTWPCARRRAAAGQRCETVS